MQILKNKKEDPVKQGLEDLQRVLPHLGSPGEEKVSDDKLKSFINSSTQNYINTIIIHSKYNIYFIQSRYR